MEKQSRSRSHHRRHHSSATFSKKLSDVQSFGRRAAYDDIFSGRRKTGAPAPVRSSRVEDYHEIFNSSKASRGSSIPVLDLPAVTERVGSARSRSSEIDYSKIFGGLGEENFAATYEELFAEPKGRETSSDETWTPAETGSPSEDSDSFNSYEASCQPFDSKKQFNMSYHKANQRSRDGTNGTTHIAQLHAVPGFTRVIDEETPLQRTKENEPVPPKIIDSIRKQNLSGEISKGRHSKRAVADFRKQRANRPVSEGDLKFQIDSCGDNTIYNDPEIKLRRTSAKVPPLSDMSLNFDNHKDGSYRSIPPNSEVSRSPRCSPPFSDDEVDVNSAAAASAIALRKAIVEAQARIKIAKALMMKNNKGFDYSLKSSFKDKMRKERKEGKVASIEGVLDENPHENWDSFDIAEQVFIGMGKPTPRSVGNMMREDAEGPFLAKEASEAASDQDCKSIPVDHRWSGAGIQEAAKQFYEAAITGIQKVATFVSVQADGRKNLLQPLDEEKEREATNKAIEQPVQIAGQAYEQTEMEQSLCDLQRSKVRDENFKIPNKGQGINEQVDNKMKFRVFPGQAEPEEKLKVYADRNHVEEKVENSLESLDVNEHEVRGWDENRKEGQLDEAQELVQNERQPDVAPELELSEPPKCEAHSGNLLEMNELSKNEKNFTEGNKCREDYNENLIEPCGCEYDEEVNCTSEVEDNGSDLDEVVRQDLDEKQLNDLLDGEDSDERLEDVNAKCEVSQDDEDNEKIPEEASCFMGEDKERLKEDAEKREGTYGLWTENLSEDDISETNTDSEENGNMMNTGQIALTHEEHTFKADDGVCGCTEVNNTGQAQEPCMDDTVIEELGMACDDMATDADEIEKMVDMKKASGALENDNLKVINLEKTMHEGEVFDRAGLVEDGLNCDEILSNLKSGASPMVSFDKLHSVGAKMNFEGIKIDWNKNQDKLAFDLQESVQSLAYELGNDVELAQEAKVSCDPKVFDDGLGAVDQSMDQNENNMGTAPLPSVYNSEKEVLVKAVETKRVQTTENENDCSEAILGEETKKESQSEPVLDKKDIRKMTEEQVKEKERERGRLAVEKAIREARERAFAEARERVERAAVERATAEARLRVNAKAQERFQKASEEAKLKAERAAVERATAEVRERALQKAMSGKAASEDREHLERFSTEKFTGVSRDNGVKQKFPSSGPQFQGSGPSTNTRYSSSSNHNVPNGTAISDGTNNDSALRCQAKLEKHQRTAERAAKALAEKNMRDLLAQKEQAERNRLAEGLDADVKRWSSGKQGNLRALLSTLQYILGPDSGWQPIPLTAIVTTSAVKKAYRKAALCVHPDKLQQRGASIQQKYICEKVFDLLKDAWNKFNSEER